MSKKNLKENQIEIGGTVYTYVTEDIKDGEVKLGGGTASDEHRLAMLKWLKSGCKGPMPGLSKKG